MEKTIAHRVMVARGVLADRAARERLEAMLPFVEGAPVEIAPNDAVEAALARIGLREDLPRGGLEGRGTGKDLVAFALANGGDVFPGYPWCEKRDAKTERSEHGVLCQTALEVQSVVGCPFDCTYCPYTRFLCVRLDVDRFVDRVARLAVSRRSQSVFKLNNRTDTLGLEPEYGLARALVERFADLDGKHLMLYSKADAVDHLVGLEHGGRTIASFTLTPDPVAALLEVGAPPPAARLAALGRLARAGYPIRVRFSPIVPLGGWRESYEDLVDRLFEVARPEMVTLWTLSMVDLEDLGRVVPLDAVDQEALAAARASADAMRGLKGAPFPPAVRVALYREIAGLVHARSPETVVAPCLETPDVWESLADLVSPRRGGAFLCNCGPRSTPEAVRLCRARPG